MKLTGKKRRSVNVPTRIQSQNASGRGGGRGCIWIHIRSVTLDFYDEEEMMPESGMGPKHEVPEDPDPLSPVEASSLTDNMDLDYVGEEDVKDHSHKRKREGNDADFIPEDILKKMVNCLVDDHDTPPDLDLAISAYGFSGYWHSKWARHVLREAALTVREDINREG